MTRIKVLIISAISFVVFLIFGISIYAASATNKAAATGYTLCSNIYATTNIKVDEAINLMSDWMVVTNGEFKTEPEASFTYEMKSEEMIYFYFTHDGGTFTVMSRIHRIESKDTAEYCIFVNNYDNYLIAVDGSTTKTNPGVYLTAFIEENKNYQKYPEFSLYTSIATDYSLHLVEGEVYQDSTGAEYEAYAMAKIGYHLCNGNEVEYQDSVSDKEIYGGSDENDITLPEETDDETEPSSSNGKNILLLTISIVTGSLMLFGIYKITRQIIKIFRKDN